METSLSRFFSTARTAVMLFLIVATPLVFLPAAYEQFMRPKVAWIQILAAILILLASMRMLASVRVHVPIHAVNLLLLAYLLWNAVLWPLADSPSLAAERIQWLSAILITSWGWQEWLRENPSRRILLAAKALVWAAGVTAAWTIYQDLCAKWGASLPRWLPQFAQAQNKLGDWRGLLTAGFGNTDHIASFLAFSYLPALLLLLFAKKLREIIALQALLFLMSAALILCWSVGNNAALIVASLLLLFGIGHGRRRRLFARCRTRLIVWTACCACAIGWLVTNNPANPHRPGLFQEAFSSDRWIAGGPTRGVIWLNTLEMIRQNQFTGVGPGNFPYAYPRMQSSAMPQKPAWLNYQGAYTNAAHNALLQEWAELGPLGALLLLGAVLMAFRSLRQLIRTAHGIPYWAAWGCAVALTAWCASSLMTFPLQLPTSTLLFFLLLPVGEILRGHAARGHRYALPPLVRQGLYGETVLYMPSMARLSSIAFSLSLPAWLAIGIALLCIAACGGWAWIAVRPVQADIVYNRAHTARVLGNTPQADRLYQRALAIYPWHHDARSEYSEFLLQNHRYEDALRHLQIVMKRLDARELYLRRATAHEALGNKTAARRDWATFQSRSPRPKPSP